MVSEKNNGLAKFKSNFMYLLALVFEAVLAKQSTISKKMAPCIAF